MTRAEYQKYLASREWAVLKRQVRERSRGKCERCHRRPHEQTHHLTYERLGAELLEDLQGLCETCHEYVSGRRHVDPAGLPGCAACGGTDELHGWVLDRERFDLCKLCNTMIIFWVGEMIKKPTWLAAKPEGANA
jgi:hypothetical protein